MLVTIIGSGNVGTLFALTFKELGCTINQIYSRNKNNAKTLSNKVDAQAIDNIKQITDNSDLYIIAIVDDEIENIIIEFPFCLISNQIVVHTSGSFATDQLSVIGRNYGCLYPLQSISIQNIIELSTTPILIWGNNQYTEIKLIENAEKMSARVEVMNDNERKHLHLAAVIANNFSNHLWHIAEKYCHENKIDFSLLHPLLLEGVRKTIKIGAAKAQTGPAYRNDQKIIDSHLTMLQYNQALVDIYNILTKSIIEYKNNHNK